MDYRTFRNTDPPGLVAVWNAAFTGRGTIGLQGPTWMEYFLFSKPYFDPNGLLIAHEAGRIVGFAWAGFGPNDDETALDSRSGVLCLLGVSPSHRGRGVGSELLRRAEAYLRQRGSIDLFAGPMRPLNPYTFGLYGGSGSPGFLESDSQVRPFLERRGYAIEHTCLVFQHTLQPPLVVTDGRFAALRPHYEIHAAPLQNASWWRECVLGPIDMHEFRLQDKRTGRAAARAFMWEMETYGRRWNEHAIGISDLVVQEKLRRQGLGKFLLVQILRYLQDQFFTIVELQARADNTAAVNLLRGLDFKQIDAGHIYRKR